MLYIDPAATSMLLSSITAIVVACGAGIFMAWRAMKKKVKKVLHIDENANKEMEDELVINDEAADDNTAEKSDDAEQPATAAAPADTAKKATTKPAAKKSTTKAVPADENK